jgi:hypothetical protein
MKQSLLRKLAKISDEQLIGLNDKLAVKRTKLRGNSSRLFSCVKSEIYARWVSEKESTSVNQAMADRINELERNLRELRSILDGKPS